MQGIALALLRPQADTGRATPPSVMGRLRDLTLSWSRFHHAGPMLEDDSLERLLTRAHEHGARRCFVQRWGHVIDEVWRPGVAGPIPALAQLDGTAGWMLACDSEAVDGGCFFVDLDRWVEAGRPDLRSPAVPRGPLPEETREASVDLLAAWQEAPARIESWLGEGIATFDAHDDSNLDPRVRRYLGSLQRLTGNLRRGVFVWNLEPYDDIENPPSDAGPLTSLFSVAAGLKSNRLLETHGFDPTTRVVFFDYSPPGLEFRRRLLEGWNGRDYPDFLRRLFRELPEECAFYLLWDEATPSDPDWDRMAERWCHELDAWGGAETLARHWRSYRQLDHSFVYCDLLGSSPPEVADLLEPEERVAIWWSNAFSTVLGNWFQDGDTRASRFDRWLDTLAKRTPRAILYGATSDNVSVHGTRAGDYAAWHREQGGDRLHPAARHHTAIRF